MSTPRHGKPYIYVTWLAKLLGGDQCLWSAWFKAHFKYDKYEEMALDLVKWNRDHNRLMAVRRQELEEDGWSVTVENQNDFKLEGAAAVVAGKMDLVATKPGQILVVDGKTGKERESDVWQVLLYLFAVPKSRPDLTGDLVGEVFYKGGSTVTLTPAELTPERLNDVVSLIKTVSAHDPPSRVPSRTECQRCNVGPSDCPDRVSATREVTTAVAEF